MTQAEKLEALVEYGRKHGYYNAHFMNADGSELYPMAFRDYMSRTGLLDFLLDHDFARALFGGGEVPNPNTAQALFSSDDYLIYLGTAAQFHVQQAVISDNPIDYMYKAVFDA